MLLSVPAPAAIAAGCTGTLERLRSQIIVIENDTKGTTAARVLLPLEQAMADANDALATTRFAQIEASDPGTRETAEDCLVRASTEEAALQSDPRLFAAVKRSPGSALRTYWLRRLRHFGGTVAAEHRDEFAGLQEELRGLQGRFDHALELDTTSIVVGRRDLGGIPSDLLQTFERRRNGAAVVPVNENTAAFLADATSASARRAYEQAEVDRVRAAAAPVLERLVTVRDRVAHLAGFETWADYELGDGPISAMQAEKAARTHAADPLPVETGATSAPASDVLAHAFKEFGSQLGVAVTDASLDTYRVTDALAGGLLGTIATAPAAAPSTAFVSTVLLPARTIGGMRRPPLILIALPPDGRLTPEQTRRLDAAVGEALAATLAQAPYESLNTLGGARGQLIRAVFTRLAGGAVSGDDSVRALHFAETGERADPALLDATSDLSPSFFIDFIDHDAALLTGTWSQACAERLLQSFNGTRFRRDLLDPAASQDLTREVAKLLE